MNVTHNDRICSTYILSKLIPKTSTRVIGWLYIYELACNKVFLSLVASVVVVVVVPVSSKKSIRCWFEQETWMGDGVVGGGVFKYSVFVSLCIFTTPRRRDQNNVLAFYSSLLLLYCTGTRTYDISNKP